MEDKLFVVNEIILENKSIGQVSREHNILRSTLSDWIRKYKLFGEDGLRPYKQKYVYSEAIKKKAVEEFLFERASKLSIVKKYNISSKAVLLGWITNYNKRKALKKTGRGLSTMKSKNPTKKTNTKERIEIVQYTLAHDNDYQAAIEKYGVSYQQIYNWVRKYNTLGIEGLKDKRGRNQPLEELSELDKLRLENKRLKSRNDYLEMEKDFEKKLQELRHLYKTFR